MIGTSCSAPPWSATRCAPTASPSSPTDQARPAIPTSGTPSTSARRRRSTRSRWSQITAAFMYIALAILVVAIGTMSLASTRCEHPGPRDLHPHRCVLEASPCSIALSAAALVRARCRRSSRATSPPASSPPTTADPKRQTNRRHAYGYKQLTYERLLGEASSPSRSRSSPTSADAVRRRASAITVALPRGGCCVEAHPDPPRGQSARSAGLACPRRRAVERGDDHRPAPDEVSHSPL